MKNILIVDDEEEVRALLQDKLRKSGYGVMAVKGGEDALEACKVFSPDLILLDIAMPDMNGYQACNELREHKKTKKVPVLFLTGKDLDSRAIEERCGSLGAAGYLSKTSSLKEILDKIEEVLNKR